MLLILYHFFWLSILVILNKPFIVLHEEKIDFFQTHLDWTWSCMHTIFDGICTLINILIFVMGFNSIWIKPLINPWHINHYRQTDRVKPLAFELYELIKIKYFRASRISRLMQFPITYLILVKEIIKHL